MSVSYGGDSITFADSSTISSGWTGFKNRIINGNMAIDQRNAGASVVTSSSPTFAVDRWAYYTNATVGAFNAGQNLNSVTPPAGFTKYLGFQVASAQTPSGSHGYFFGQKIEGFNGADLGWGAAGAASIAISFWVRSSLTGNHSANVQNASNNRSYVFAFTINSANTWEYKTVTIPGDTTGTWASDNTAGLILYFNLGCGSGISTAAGSWNAAQYMGVTGGVSVVSTSGATFYITGVQLEKGSTASSFEFRPIGTELALCQRYFCKSGSMNTPVPAVGAVYTNNDNFIAGIFNGYAANSGFAPFLLFPVEMRTVPTLTFIPSNLGGTTNQISIWVGSGWIGTSPAPQTFNSRGFNLLLSGSWSVGPWLTYYAYTASSEL